MSASTRAGEISTHKSFCRFCHACCAIDVDVADGKVVKVRGDRDNPMFRGYTCIKGRELPAQHNHPDRLRTSLRRSDGEFEAISSERALDEIAERLQAIIAEHGPRAVAVYGGTGAFQCATGLNVAKAWLKGLGSPSFYSSVTIDQPAKVVISSLTGFWQGGVQSFESADVVMMIGNNPLISSFAPQGTIPGFSPADKLRSAQRRGLRLICIDPRVTELARQADLHLQPVPGEDPTLLAGMLRVVLTEDLYDQAFCEQYVEGLDELRQAVLPFEIEAVSRRVGVPGDQIVAAARMFAEGPRGIAGTGTGPSMAPHSTLMEHLVSCLNVVCGRFNRAGDEIINPGVLSPRQRYKAQVIPASVMQGIFRRGDPPRVRDIAPILGEQPTTSLPDEILTEGEGQIRALISIGGNPVVAFPDQLKTLEAFSKLELHITHDVHMGATARLCDYVVASTLSLERADLPTTVDPWFEAPYTQYTPAIIEPDFDVISEWEFLYGLARRMGTPIKLPGGELDLDVKPTSDDVLDLLFAKSRVPLSEVRKHDGGHIYELDPIHVQPPDADSTARFTIAPGAMLAELEVVSAETTSGEQVAGFDPEIHTLRLISRRLRHVLNSTGQHISGLRSKGATNHAYMHPDDATSRGLCDGDLIDITSPRASIRGIVAISDDLRPGVVSMSHSWGGTPEDDGAVREIGSPTGRLADLRSYDSITGIPCMSAIPVSVEQAQDI
jgi:anaerobic selenocysteine-containing dehydrogenase